MGSSAPSARSLTAHLHPRAAAVLLGLVLSLPLPSLAADPMTCAYDPAGTMAKAVTVTAEELLAAVEAPAAPGPFRIQLQPGPALQANPAALAVFRRAAAAWEAVIRSPMTITLRTEFSPLQGRALGATTPAAVLMPFDMLATALRTAATREAADAVARTLPTAAQLAVRMPPGFVPSGSLLTTKPLLKVAGFTGLDQRFGPTDGTINLNSSTPFDLDNSNGVTAGQFDLESILVHEIGHALGFISGVDSGAVTPAQPTRLALMPLDLFRFRTEERPLNAAAFTTATRSIEQAVPAVFGDVAHAFAFSTGRNGDGLQASHWKADDLTGIQIGVMDPTIGPGTIARITSADLRAFDLIGYDISVAEALPVVSIATVNGRPATGMPVVPANTPITFTAQATDADGLGAPILAAQGNRQRISFQWTAPGSTPTPAASALTQSFVTRFPLAAGARAQTFPVSVNAFDTLGDRSTAQVQVRVSDAPAVRVTVDGIAPVGAVQARSGATLQLQATATDADGLGFPSLAAFGFTGNIVFQWNFGGGTVTNPRLRFTGNPPVTFTLQPNETTRTFNVSVTVTDTLGLSTTRSISVLVQR